jgi:hypothetical protein
MTIKCEQVWPEISNYLEGAVDANLRAVLETHFRECRRCRAVRDGIRNVMVLYGNERMIEPPLGFSHQLQRRLINRETLFRPPLF